MTAFHSEKSLTASSKPPKAYSGPLHQMALLLIGEMLPECLTLKQMKSTGLKFICFKFLFKNLKTTAVYHKGRIF